MTAKGLLRFFENFYGEKYAGDVLSTMTAYLDGRSEDFLKAAADVMVMRFSRCYGKSPCPADIERHMGEILDAMPRRTYIPEPRPELTEEDMAVGLGILDEIRRDLKSHSTAMAKNLAILLDSYPEGRGAR